VRAGTARVLDMGKNHCDGAADQRQLSVDDRGVTLDAEFEYALPRQLL
jgi:hypothetical protein